jgi:hypothetical protein
MQSISMRKRVHGTALVLSLLSLPVALLATSGPASAGMTTTASTTAKTAPVTTSSLGTSAPTFVGPAATGCVAVGCDLLSGPFRTPSTAGIASHPAASRSGETARKAHAIPLPTPPLRGKAGAPGAAGNSAIPTVSCQPMRAGCDNISTSTGGAVGVKGLDAVDSGGLSTNPNGDIEPPDQGMCAGNGSVVETNNIGEILVFNTALQRQSAPISLDTLMGLTTRGESSGGDPSCLFDPSNGGHWFFTEIVSNSTEANGGAFTGCFAGVADGCSEGIAVSAGSSPFGPYNVYFANADYNPVEPGSPELLNDFAKIGTTRDAFEYFYDEFPIGSLPGIGGGGFNGAQELAFNKKAMETGQPVTKTNGSPNRNFTVAVQNMGELATPDGTCASDSQTHRPGITCWFSVIPTQAPDAAQFDNSHNGSGFMLGTLDFRGAGDNRLAVFDWTGLHALDSTNCSECGKIRFGGQLFSNVLKYTNIGQFAPQKAGPIPLGDECGAAGLSTGNPPPASCPEGGLATNGDNITQASQAQGQLWVSATTEINQKFSSEGAPELHQGVVYYVVGTPKFDKNGAFTLTSQSYISAKHEDLTMPAVAAEGLHSQDRGNGGAISLFTLTGNGGPKGADNGGFFPSTAYGRITSTSAGLTGSVINVADMGQAPQDGFTEYQGFPGGTRPRWGDYSEGVYLPGTGRIYFANEYIQSPNCTGSAFTLTVGTCGGTRDGFANWGTSVNYVTP